MIPQETVARILDAARIEEVVSDFVTLKRRGGDFVACCPFHNEKTPSFHVSPSRNIYKCFGCGKAGSPVGFVMEYEHLSFVEALRYLADKYHIEVREKEETAEEIAARARNESLFLVSDFAGKFFEEQLSQPEGKAIGYRYFKSRGLEDVTISKYHLGWAPKSRKAFTEAAKAAGYKDEYLLDTGLCAVYDSDNTLHDRFYDRVIFPIHSVSGRVIAFGGRTLLSDKTVAKYVNSKESEIYVKSRSLYGLYYAKNEMARKDKCYLVEGYLDVLSMHQLGIMNVVASSGTSLTVEQIRLIKRFTENVTIMYDGDSAGIHAAIRGINMVLREGMNVKVVLIPDGDDPDSYSRKHTLEEVQSFIAAHERDFISFKTDLLLEEAGDDPLKKANLINDIADSIAEIPDAVKRSVYVDACAGRFNIEADILFARIVRTREKLLNEARMQSRRDNDGPVAAEGRREGESEMQRLPVSPVTAESAVIENDRFLAPSEKELLSFILRNGRDPLNFPSDSPFYDPDPPEVADFIDSALSADGASFVNDAYRLTYDAYFDLYDKGLSQEQIVMTLLSGEDRTVAYVTSQLFEQKYDITVKAFSASMTATSSWLVNYVPKAILVYQEKKMERRSKDLLAALASAPEQEQERIMAEMKKVQDTLRLIRKKTGRE